MFSIDEKSMADNRTLITINKTKQEIDPITKNGTLNFVSSDNTIWLTTSKIRSAYVKKQDTTPFYDRVLLAKDGKFVDGTYTFNNDNIFASNLQVNKDLLIKGNLTVEGQSSTIDTPKLSVEDNIIELNRNEKGHGVALDISGSAINRGLEPFARILFSENQKAFLLDTGAAIDKAPADTDWIIKAYIDSVNGSEKGELRVKNLLNSPNVKTNILTVFDSASINKLTVPKASTFIGAATFGDTVTVNGEFLAKSNANFNSTMSVNKAATFKDDLIVQKNLNVTGLTTLNDLATLNKGIKITSGGANITGITNITGAQTTTGTLHVTDNVVFDKDLKVGLTTTLKDLIASTAKVTTATIATLNVTGNSNLTGNLGIKGTLSVSGATTLENALKVNNDETIAGHNLILTADANGNNGNITAAGNITSSKKITANSAAIAKDFTADSVTANIIKSNTNYVLAPGNGNGLRFWDSEDYKIFMGTTAVYGQVANADASDYNMYFQMKNPTNRGFVFKNSSTSVMQIEGNGNVRNIGRMFAHGSQVLTFANMGHAPKEEQAINACMVDGKHSTDLILRDGTQAMTGDLALNGNRINFANNDYISYNDDTVTLNTKSYAGAFSFTADNTDNSATAVLKAGALKLGSMIFTDDNSISGISYLRKDGKTFLQATDSWLRLNGDNPFTNGIYMGASVVRTDGTFQIMSTTGKVFEVNATHNQYKGYDVLTTAGVSNMLGHINMGQQKLLFNYDNLDGTDGIASSDFGKIYGEHIKDAEDSKLVIEIGDNEQDSIVLRTSNCLFKNAFKKDSIVVNYNKVTFSDNPYYSNNRLLHTGDTGAGHGLDADTVDGKHLSDLSKLYVNKAGDTMTGKLTLNSDLGLNAANKILFNNSETNLIRAGGADNTSMLFSSNTFIFYPKNDTTKATIINSDGTVTVLGSKVVTKADYGSGNGIDADTLDGKHYDDLTQIFVNAVGDTMVGDLNIKKADAAINLFGTGSRFRIISSSNTSCIQAGVNSTDNCGNLVISGYEGKDLSSFNILIKDSAKATINKNKILTNADMGSGKGLDADKLDGKHSTDFATANHNHDAVYAKRSEVDLHSKYKIEYNASNDSLDFLYL